MSPKEIISKKPVTLSTVKEILKQREEEGEHSFIQKVTLDYVTKFSKLSAEDAEKLVNELHEKFEIDYDIATQIVNSMPTTIHDLRIFLPEKAKRKESSDLLQEIIDLLNQYR